MAPFNHRRVKVESPAEQAVHDACVIAWGATAGTKNWRECTAGEWADYVLSLFRERLNAEREKLGLSAGPPRLPSDN